VTKLIELPANEPRRVGQTLVGQVELVDAFGNLITNIREADLPSRDRRAFSITVGGVRFTGIGRSYSDQPVGSPLALFGSSGRLEVAVNQGSAASMLSLSPGVEVRIE
jgi:S-adenosylmethionine hydrolase